jgi:hypothetical protein
MSIATMLLIVLILTLIVALLVADDVGNVVWRVSSQR